MTRKWWMPRFLEILAECRGNVNVTEVRQEDPRGPARSTVCRSLETCPRFRRGWTAIVPRPRELKSEELAMASSQSLWFPGKTPPIPWISDQSNSATSFRRCKVTAS